MFKKLFSKQKVTDEYIIVQLNDKIMPLDRSEVYEEPLDKYLHAKKYGEVTGGGTMQHKTGEIEFCELEILLNCNQNREDSIYEIIKFLEIQGAPKGSFVRIDTLSKEIFFGKKEGLAIYLDGVNLPTNVYEECDINYVLYELNELLGDSGNIQRYWEGENETALYFYGESYDKMYHAISDFVKTYPLCQGARVVQIS